MVIETERDLERLKEWAAVGKQYGMVQLIQLSHPGRQCPKGLNKETVAPSAVPFSPALATMFGTHVLLRMKKFWILLNVLRLLLVFVKRRVLKGYSYMVHMAI